MNVSATLHRKPPTTPPVEKVTLELDPQTARSLLALVGAIGAQAYDDIRHAPLAYVEDLPPSANTPPFVDAIYRALLPIRNEAIR